MNEPRALVEHFFRHEFGRLVAVLTRSLGVRRLDLVEDVVNPTSQAPDSGHKKFNSRLVAPIEADGLRPLGLLISHPTPRGRIAANSHT